MANLKLVAKDIDLLRQVIDDNLGTAHLINNQKYPDLFINKNILAKIEEKLSNLSEGQIMALEDYDIDMLKNALVNILYRADYDWYGTVYNISKKEFIDLLCKLNSYSETITFYKYKNVVD